MAVRGTSSRGMALSGERPDRRRPMRERMRRARDEVEGDAEDELAVFVEEAKDGAPAARGSGALRLVEEEDGGEGGRLAMWTSVRQMQMRLCLEVEIDEDFSGAVASRPEARAVGASIASIGVE